MTAQVETVNADVALLGQWCEAVSQDMETLAFLHGSEPKTETVKALRTAGFPNSLGLQLASEAGKQAQALIREALADLPRDLDQEALDWLAVDYADIYLNYSLQASPLESVWVDDDHLAYQESMFQVRAYYQRFGLSAADWRKRSEDHLVLQLHFLAYLFGQDLGKEVLSDAARFMDEHLLRWVPDFAERVACRCGTRYFAGLALLTAAYMEELRQILERLLDEPRPSADEIDARMRPKCACAEAVPVKFVPGAKPSW